MNGDQIDEITTIIAKFMGYTKSGGHFYLNSNKGTPRWFKIGRYHASYEWMMPVLKKIRSLNPDKGKLWFEYEISHCHCVIRSNTGDVWRSNGKNDLDAILKTVLKFIDYYNQFKLKDISYCHETANPSLTVVR